MFNENIMEDVSESYKRDFAQRWPKEKYKWEAVKHFQNNWNVNAKDFADMLLIEEDFSFKIFRT